jgi:hypothetical protein
MYVDTGWAGIDGLIIRRLLSFGTLSAPWAVTQAQALALVSIERELMNK